MKHIKRDIVIPKEMLELFKNSIRIIEKNHLAGFWPPDLMELKKLQKSIPELFGNAAIMKKYDVAITYNGKSMKNDFSKMGFDFSNDRIVTDIFIQGIPVPWRLLKNAGIDHKKFNVILTPKEMR